MFMVTAPLSSPGPPDADSWLLDLAGLLQADGRMPGGNDEERALASTLALLCFLAAGRDALDRRFRRHVERLIKFLEKVRLPLQRRVIVEAVLGLARRGESLPGAWREPLDEYSLTLDLWDRIEASLLAG